MKRLILLPILVVSAQAQTKLFSSGFEGGTALSSLPASPTISAGNNSLYPTFSGLDTSTGYNWSTFQGLWGGGSTTGFHLIPGNGLDGSPFSAGFQNSIDTTVSHSGNASLHIKTSGFTNPNCNPACGQNVFQVGGTAQRVDSFYLRYWVKFGPELVDDISQAKFQQYGNLYDRNMFEMKFYSGGVNYRINTFVYGTNHGTAYWHAQADNAAVGAPTQTYWAVDNTTVPVPLDGSWFLMEVYWNRSTGKFFWGINGTTIANYTDTHAGNENPLFFGIVNEYNNYWPAEEWVDDLEIWDSPPCGAASLPCGPASSGPSLTVTSSLSFGTQAQNTTSTARQVTITNPGTATATLSSITATGDFAKGSSTCGATLAVQASCTVNVTFTPTALGVRNGTLVVTDTPDSITATTTLSGTGVDPTAPYVVNQTFCSYTSFPTSCAIPAVTANNLIVAEFGTFNTAGTSSTMSGITDNAAGGSNTYQACPGARSVNTQSGSGYWSDIWAGVAARGSATSLTITPSATLNGAALILEIANAVTCSAGAALNSQAASTSPSGAAVTTAASKGMAVSFLHAAPGAGISGIHAGNAWTSDLISSDWAWAHYAFSAPGTFTPQWDQSSVTFASSSAVLSQSQSSTYDFSVTPTDSNGVTGGAQPLSIHVTSQSGQPAVSLDQTSYDFGDVTVEVQTAGVPFLLTNTGSAVLTITSITPTGDFSQSSNCPISPSMLGIGSSCTITGYFTPTAVGTRLGSIGIADNATGSPQTISLRGNGLPKVAGSVGTGISAGKVVVQ